MTDEWHLRTYWRAYLGDAIAFVRRLSDRVDAGSAMRTRDMDMLVDICDELDGLWKDAYIEYNVADGRAQHAYCSLIDFTADLECMRGDGSYQHLWEITEFVREHVPTYDWNSLSYVVLCGAH